MRLLLMLHLTMILLCAASLARAEQEPRFDLWLETGATWQSRNDAAIPGDTGTHFSLVRLMGVGPTSHERVTLTTGLHERNGWRFVVAPLTIRGTGTLDHGVAFGGEAFAAGVPTQGTYRFNSYRGTYWKRIHRDAVSEWRAGITLKIRDARIALRQGATAASSYDLGVVPLLYAGGEVRLAPRWRLMAEIDGLAAPQGRAFDLGVQMAYDIAPGWALALGYRTLEGGASNRRVYTFAWLNYATASVGYRF